MSFNTQKFMNVNFTPRTKEVPVPDLKEWFDKDETPIFKVRGLTGNELARVHEAVDKHKNISGILDGILSTKSKDKIEAIRAAIGIDADVPSEIAKRLEMLTIGSVDPEISLEVAVKISETFPIEFYQLTTAISELTGQGHISGKPKPSGVTNASKQP